MAKKLLICVVLATLKGLDAKDPNLYIHPGTDENPTLVELPDDAETRALVDAGLLRIYTGPQAAPVPDSEKVRALLAEVETLKGKILVLSDGERTLIELREEVGRLKGQLASEGTEIERLLGLLDAAAEFERNSRAEIEQLKGQLAAKAPALKPAEIKSLQRAQPALEALIQRYELDLQTPELDEQNRLAIAGDLDEARADLDKVLAALK